MEILDVHFIHVLNVYVIAIIFRWDYVVLFPEESLKIIVLVPLEDLLNLLGVLMFLNLLDYVFLFRRLISEIFGKLLLELLSLHQELVMLDLLVNFCLQICLLVFFVLTLLPVLLVIVIEVHIALTNVEIHQLVLKDVQSVGVRNVVLNLTILVLDFSHIFLRRYYLIKVVVAVGRSRVIIKLIHLIIEVYLLVLHILNI